jgi:putative transposase
VSNDKLSVAGQRVRLPVVGYVRMTETLRFKGKLLSAVVSREVDRWFISISVEIPEPAVAAPGGEPVGIDLGLTTYATISTGERVKAPKPLAVAARRMRRLQRRLSRKVKGSQNRRKAARRVARLHYRIKNVRRDFVHKFTTRIASTHRQVCIEDLNVAGMSKNHALASSISDVLWFRACR